MIQQEQYTRNGKSYTVHFGTDENGAFTLFIDENQADEFTGQPVRYVPESLNIRFNTEGKPELISTKWKKILLTNTGLLFTSTAVDLSMATNEKDAADFTTMFASVFQRFMANGFIRSIQGHNYQPLFDATGARIPDANYDTTIAPTNNYQTHNADGTEINPVESPVNP